MIVTLPYDPDWHPLEFAKTHCSSYITNDVHWASEPGKPVQIDYYFGNERDAMWFTLRWS